MKILQVYRSEPNDNVKTLVGILNRDRDLEESLNNAFHIFVMFRHDSLFVMDGNKLVGMLRFSDVYREIGRRIKETCRL